MESIPSPEKPVLEKQVCGFEDEFSLSAGSCCDEVVAVPEAKAE